MATDDEARALAVLVLPRKQSLMFCGCARRRLAILGDSWKYESKIVRFVLARETRVCSVQEWRCIRKNKGTRCTARAHSGELRLTMQIEHMLKY